MSSNHCLWLFVLCEGEGKHSHLAPPPLFQLPRNGEKGKPNPGAFHRLQHGYILKSDLYLYRGWFVNGLKNPPVVSPLSWSMFVYVGISSGLTPCVGNPSRCWCFFVFISWTTGMLKPIWLYLKCNSVINVIYPNNAPCLVWDMHTHTMDQWVCSLCQKKTHNVTQRDVSYDALQVKVWQRQMNIDAVVKSWEQTLNTMYWCLTCVTRDVFAVTFSVTVKKQMHWNIPTAQCQCLSLCNFHKYSNFNQRPVSGCSLWIKCKLGQLEVRPTEPRFESAGVWTRECLQVGHVSVLCEITTKQAAVCNYLHIYKKKNKLSLSVIHVLVWFFRANQQRKDGVKCHN